MDKKRRYRERGDYHDELGLLLLARERPEKGLGCCEADGVGGAPDHKQRADHREGTETYEKQHVLHRVVVKQTGAALEYIARADARDVQGNNQPPHYARKSEGRCVRTHPTSFLTQFPGPFFHATTLQHHRPPERYEKRYEHRFLPLVEPTSEIKLLRALCNANGPSSRRGYGERCSEILRPSRLPCNGPSAVTDTLGRCHLHQRFVRLMQIVRNGDHGE